MIDNLSTDLFVWKQYSIRAFRSFSTRFTAFFFSLISLCFFAGECTSPNPIYMITLNANGGNPGKKTFITVERGKTPALLVDSDYFPTLPGYRLAGWKTEINKTEIPFIFGSTPVVGNVTVFAQWVPVRTVTLDPNKGAGSVKAISVDDGMTADAPSEKELPTREGYVLTSWNKQSDGNGSPFIFGTTRVTSNITIYAQWMLKVSFESNGGTKMNPILVRDNEFISKPSDPSLKGYKFVAWFKEPTFDTEFNFSTESITKSITLYAKWDAILINTVSFNKNNLTICFNRNSQLKVIIYPTEVANETMKWESSNPQYATVDQTGIISPVSLGTTTITATTKDGTNKSVSTNVTVGPYFYIPDNNFRNALMNYNDRMSKQDNNVDKLWFKQVDDVDGLKINTVKLFSSNVVVSSSNIVNMSGIEYFTAITSLSFSNNQVTNIDLSKNTALTSLNFSGNQITNIDLSKNTALSFLQCSNNRFETLDLSKNTALTYLECSYNRIETLDLSKNTALTAIYCNNNGMASLDVSRCAVLTHLTCSFNALEILDISKNTLLSALYCEVNLLSNLDARMNPALKTIFAYLNNLTSIDVTKCTALVELSLWRNYLTRLDVSNNHALNYLLCPENKLTNLDMSKNTLLKVLNCSKNMLSNLDVSKNPDLNWLSCSFNYLTNLNLNNNPALTSLYCSYNQLSNLDLSRNRSLTKLDCISNGLINLDIRGMRSAESLRILKEGNIVTNSELSSIKVHSDLVSSTSSVASLELREIKSTLQGAQIDKYNGEGTTNSPYTTSVCDYDPSTGRKVAGSNKSCK